jgi:CHAT domain-containing protein/tetratricopeptide (TPR) repeat protein
VRTILLAAALALATPAAAADPGDSFRLGASGLCTAEVATGDKALTGLFDTGYAILCRDAAAPVGRLYALRLGGDDPAARLAGLRAATADCEAPARTAMEGLGPVETLSCRLKGEPVGYRVYLLRRGRTLYAAEGLAGYDSALRLGLRSLVAGRALPGEVEVAITGAGDPAAFARLQAGTLDPGRARAEAYRRNNAGSFAESAEFFATVAEADTAGGRAELIANAALQQSNLGAFERADKGFAEAAALQGNDPVVARLLRNFRTIHFMNQGDSAAALAELDKPMPPATPDSKGAAGTDIDPATAARLNAESPLARQLGAAGGGLTAEERARLLDAQALHLRGGILRLEHRTGEAAAALRGALDALRSVRRGRVDSVEWMRAQIWGEQAVLAEERGAAAEAERLHKAAVSLLEAGYPGSPALLSAEARLAGYYARTGRTEEARALYRAIVDASETAGIASLGLRRALAPYFRLLVDRPDPAELFRASQLLVRPGVAQTQALLARELSGGSDEAARLFRQSVTLGRDIERTRIDLARLAAVPQPTAEDMALLAVLRTSLAGLEKDQVAVQARLAAFPRYRVLSSGAMSLADLQQLLRPGEAYYKIIFVNNDGYGLYVTPGSARSWRLPASADEVDREVTALRGTLASIENGQVVTYPFDVALAYRLFDQLLGPAAADLASVRHLIFEPDGALLRLPPNLLVTDRASVDRYLAKARRPNDDGFDFTGISWLGRGRDVSTAVSARSFRDLRRAAPSHAPNAYLGLGQNAPPPAADASDSALKTLLGRASPCAWPDSFWMRPISATELYAAGDALKRNGASGVEILTGAAFSDSALKARGDLARFRILHFATHGLVGAPRPECPARPALMTSFGGAGSDGLLTFAEIYDLRIDADLVILSACDTAGKASLAATREAGLGTGGDSALDGLVRAFVGAGGRSVIASHWPVPDDYGATERLITGLFQAPAGTPVATALREAETALMDRPETSHPYYWAGFALVGDGAAPLLAIPAP